MNREVHVRFCEGVGVKFPRATRPLIHTFAILNYPPHFVPDSLRVKCELRDVIHTSSSVEVDLHFR